MAVSSAPDRARARSALDRRRIRANAFYEGKFLINPFDEIGSSIEFCGVLEATLTAIVRDAARRDFDYVDVGANIGVHFCGFCLAALSARAAWRAIAFEPEPSLFAALVANCRLNNMSRARCCNVGLSEEPGTARLFLSNTSNKGNNTFVADGRERRESIECKLSTLDREIAGADFERVLVKIDAEGYEQKVLLGGRRWLSDLSDAIVVLEIFPSLLQDAGDSARAIGILLRSVGFCEPMLVNDRGTIRSDGVRAGTVYNLLYVKGSTATESAAQWRAERWLLTEADAGWRLENP